MARFGNDQTNIGRLDVRTAEPYWQAFFDDNAFALQQVFGALTKNLTGLKESSRQWDCESYAVSGFVVAGRTPSASDPARQKSFELYRANSRSVTIVTYDEILERLRLLRDFLTPASPTAEEV